MSIISMNTNTTGLVGSQIEPRRVTIVTTDNLATVTTAGYLNNANKLGFPIMPTDVIDMLYSYSESTQQGTYGIFQPVFSGTAGSQTITLNAWENPGNVLLPVVDGDFANFNGTAGQIKDSGYSATDATKTKVVMADAAVVVGNVASFADTAGTVADSGVVAANIQDGTNIIAQQSADIGGAGAGPINITVTGATAASVAVATVLSSTNAVQIQTVVPGTDQIAVTFSGDPGAAAVINYVVFIAAQ